MSMSICPGCGLKLESIQQGLDERYNASKACWQLYLDLSVFTISLADTYFIHQIIVDAYGAQHSGPHVKPITTAFALIGLYLVFERGHTGKEAQLAHMELGKKRQEWPRFTPPTEQSLLTVRDVLLSPEEKRKDMIMKWGKSVWDLWKPEHKRVGDLIEKYLKTQGT
jgi:hypothetical protein